MATQNFKAKFDFSKVDISKVDPERLNMGTGLQDCALIAQTFERGAHTIPTEAAVFATLTRSLQNRKAIAKTAADSMESYLKAPAEAAENTLEQATSLSSSVEMGTSSQTDQGMQSLNIGATQQSTVGEAFGKKLLQMAKDCIPCNLRLLAFLELHPDLDLLSAYEDFIKGSLSLLLDIGNLLKDFNIFGDFCNLLRALSFMCIPDLQRIIAALMAMFLLNGSLLDGLIGMLQALIAPLFAPILMALGNLLDQFSQLVVAPLRCVLDALNAILRMQHGETALVSISQPNLAENEFSGTLRILTSQLEQAMNIILAKRDFYIGQIRALLGELGGGDSAYIQVKFQMLTQVRLIAFVIAIILALTQGHAACDTTGKPADQNELDSFFQNYLSPTTPFNIWIDPAGQIHVDEKLPDFDKAIQNPSTGLPLSQFGNVLQFEGGSLLDPTSVTGATATSGTEGNIANILGGGGAVGQGAGQGAMINFVGAAAQVAASLTAPTQTTVPCKLEVTASDLEKVNRWIAGLK